MHSLNWLHIKLPNRTVNNSINNKSFLEKKVSRFIESHSNNYKENFYSFTSSELIKSTEGSHFSKHSLGKFLQFIKNLHKLREFSLVSLLWFTVKQY